VQSVAPIPGNERKTPMQIDLTPSDLEVLLESLEYSERNVRDALGTPYAVRRENLQRLADVAEKLRTAKKTKTKT
jgi:hypothetical protein